MSVHWGGKGPGHVSRWPKAVGPVNTYSGATMLLDFLNPVLDPRITFSRGTNATLIDSTGKLTYAPNNLLTFTEQFGNVIWTQANITRVDGVTDPNGGSNACRITATATNAVFQQVGATIAANAIGSFWVRRVSGTGTINLVAPNGGFSTALSVTSSWQRFSALELNRTGVVFVGIRITTNGDAVEIAFPQVEAVTYQTTPSTYVATAASAYYGPRFDYDPVTLAPRGLLIEEARTNLLLRSDDFANAAWSVINATITANATASPDGTINADLVTYTGGASNGPRQLVSASAGAKTYSFYVKNSSGARYFQILTDGSVQSFANYDIQTQTTGTVGTSVSAVSIINAGNGWYRLTMTATDAIATNVYIGLVASLTAGWSAGASSGAFFVYGAQLEAGSFATSYIPTVASTVTRNADVATMTGTNFSSWYNQSEGTFVSDASFSGSLASNASPFAASGDLNNYSNWTAITRNATTNVCSYNIIAGGVTQSGFTNGAAIPNATPAKAAIAYRVNDIAGSTNGAAAGTDTSATLPTLTRLLLGREQDGSVFLNGHIRTIAYFNTRLPNAQLQTLTAPSLATTLSLDFTSGSYNVGF